MNAVVVASGLVSDERSNVVSSCIGWGAGSRVREPNAAWYATFPARDTRITAPGKAPVSTPCRSTSSTRAKSTSDDGRLERDQAAAVGIQPDAHSERQRVVLAHARRRVAPCRKADADGVRRIGAESTLAGERGYAGHTAAGRPRAVPGRAARRALAR